MEGHRSREGWEGLGRLHATTKHVTTKGCLDGDPDDDDNDKTVVVVCDTLPSHFSNPVPCTVVNRDT